jgi:putative transposase
MGKNKKTIKNPKTIKTQKQSNPKNSKNPQKPKQSKPKENDQKTQKNNQTNSKINKMDKFKNKYRIPSNRKPNWDYSVNALYFLTIVTQNRVCNLGEIVEIMDGPVSPQPTPQKYEMVLSDYGKIVEQEWFKSFEIRNELILHEFVLMPNHLHAIVEICSGNDGVGDVTTVDDVTDIFHGGDVTRIDDISHIFHGGDVTRIDDVTTVETHGRASLPPQQPQQTPPQTTTNTNIQIKRNPPIRLPKSVSSFIAGFKSAVNSKIDDYIDEYKLSLPKYNRNNHFFQPNYHDHIIRNHIEYQRIKRYIINNPLNWGKDTFNR